MMLLTPIQCLVLYIGVIHTNHDDWPWGYDSEYGPFHWSEHYPTSNGRHQSPVSIPHNTVFDPDTYLAFHGYDNPDIGMVLTNSGHTAQVNVEGDAYIDIGHRHFYKLSQFHFHWGLDDSEGSEHKIFDEHFPLEVHFVHYNSKYDDIETAMEEYDGLVVIGIMFEVSQLTNLAYEPIIQKLKHITNPGTNVTIDSVLGLLDFLPKTFGDSYRYRGSLTTPPCYESVMWRVLRDYIPLGNFQIEQFRQLFFERYGVLHPLSKNFRPVKSLHKRHVYTDFPTEIIKCESEQNRTNKCSTTFDYDIDSVVLITQLSESPCINGETYFVPDAQNIKVTSGCRGRFYVTFIY